MTRRPFPSFVSIITVPLSAIRAFAPLIPIPALRNDFRCSTRMTATCSATFSREISRPSVSVSKLPTCWRVLCIMGITICEGRSCASWATHSPRSVSTGVIPRSSKYAFSSVSSLTIVLDLTTRSIPLRWHSS